MESRSKRRNPARNTDMIYPVNEDAGSNQKYKLRASRECHELDTTPTKKIRSNNEANSRTYSEEVTDTGFNLTTKFDSCATNTPSKSDRSSRRSNCYLNIVTPSTSDLDLEKNKIDHRGAKSIRRALVMPLLREVSELSSSSDSPSETAKDISFTSSKEVKKNFGHTISEKVIQANTKRVYKVVNKMTGRIGGNGSGGAIYGELTIGSMQKMVDLMKEHTNLNENSRFIDVGCGLGKPNLHVAQDPGVQFSYGIEMEQVRWVLAMTNLNKVLEDAQREDCIENIGHKCVFEHGDITEAKHFDPFTHVYMFDIGFPPTLFEKLSKMFNTSSSPYLICYHGPKLMIDRYDFDVELIVQEPTSMHGSSETHSAYLYRRVKKIKNRRRKNQNFVEGMPTNVPCDPRFVNAWKSTKLGISAYASKVQEIVEKNLNSDRPKRSRRQTSKFDNNPLISF